MPVVPVEFPYRFINTLTLCFSRQSHVQQDVDFIADMVKYLMNRINFQRNLSVSA